MKTQWNLERNEKTPFNALDEYDRLMGEQRRQSQAWRIRCLFTAVINVVLVIATCVSFTHNKVVPVFIMENDLGELRYLGNYDKVSYSGGRITDKMVEAAVRNFFTRMYSIPLDFTVLKDNISTNYAYMTNESADRYTNWLREEKPQDMFGIETAGAVIESVLRLSADSIQVDFTVTYTRIDGGVSRAVKKRAVVHTALLEPNKENIYKNPAGIYITGFDVTDIGTK